MSPDSPDDDDRDRRRERASGRDRERNRDDSDWDDDDDRGERRRRRRADDDSEMTVGEYVAAIFCSGIACIIGIVWLIQGKPKAGRMIGLSFVFVVFWNVVFALLKGFDDK